MASRKHFFGKPKYIYPQPETEEISQNVFEFDESDIHNLGDHRSPPAKKSMSISRLRRKPAKTGEESVNRRTGSVPVNVPDWSKILKSEYKGHVVHDDYDDDSDEDDDEEEEDDRELNGGETTAARRIVPPHEYLARRRGASFSVHEGIGGTLKGRDLRRVRNAIWEKLGFQD